MTEVVRETVVFQPAMPELESMNAAEREHWLALESRRARARVMRQGMAILRGWFRGGRRGAEATASGHAHVTLPGDRRTIRRDEDRDAA